MALDPIQQLGNDMIEAAEDLSIIYAKAKRIITTYWDVSDISGTVGDLPNGGDTVPGTDFTKTQYGDAINLYQQIVNLFEGAAVTEAQWHVNMNLSRTRQPAAE